MQSSFIQLETDTHVFNFNIDHIIRIQHRKGAKAATVYFTNGSTTTIPVKWIPELTARRAGNADAVSPANGHALAVRRA